MSSPLSKDDVAVYWDMWSISATDIDYRIPPSFTLEQYFKQFLRAYIFLLISLNNMLGSFIRHCLQYPSNDSVYVYRLYT